MTIWEDLPAIVSFYETSNVLRNFEHVEGQQNQEDWKEKFRKKIP